MNGMSLGSGRSSFILLIVLVEALSYAFGNRSKELSKNNLQGLNALVYQYIIVRQQTLYVAARQT